VLELVSAGAKIQPQVLLSLCTLLSIVVLWLASLDLCQGLQEEITSVPKPPCPLPEELVIAQHLRIHYPPTALQAHKVQEIVGNSEEEWWCGH
jgi:hypothetical protein